MFSNVFLLINPVETRRDKVFKTKPKDWLKANESHNTALSLKEYVDNFFTSS